MAVNPSQNPDPPRPTARRTRIHHREVLLPPPRCIINSALLLSSSANHLQQPHSPARSLDQICSEAATPRPEASPIVPSSAPPHPSPIWPPRAVHPLPATLHQAGDDNLVRIRPSFFVQTRLFPDIDPDQLNNHRAQHHLAFFLDLRFPRPSRLLTYLPVPTSSATDYRTPPSIPDFGQHLRAVLGTRPSHRTFAPVSARLLYRSRAQPPHGCHDHHLFSQDSSYSASTTAILSAASSNPLTECRAQSRFPQPRSSLAPPSISPSLTHLWPIF